MKNLADIMRTEVITIPSDATATDAWAMIKGRGFHHLVVLAKGVVAGVVSDRDLGGRNGASVRAGRLVSELMSAPAVTASPTTTLQDAARLMRGRTLGCLPVVRNGKLVGIITTSDLLELFAAGARVSTPRERRGAKAYTGPLPQTPKAGGGAHGTGQSAESRVAARRDRGSDQD